MSFQLPMPGRKDPQDDAIGADGTVLGVRVQQDVVADDATVRAQRGVSAWMSRAVFS
jgi:hypothetical protein